MYEQTVSAQPGLMTRTGDPVPLEGVAAKATIRDFAGLVSLSQRYRNRETQPIEAVYKFPLDEGAAVCAFEATIDGRRIVGRVEEREKAFETYDEALADGHGAYLLEEERADIFTASLGNIPPGKEVIIRVETVAELRMEGDAIRFTLPTTIAPRYAPAEDRRGVGESEADRVSPPVALTVPYGLELEVDIETTAALRSVESPTHPIALTLDAHRATVRLSERETALDRDFVLQVTVAESHSPHVRVERGPDGKDYVLASFRPKLEAKLAPAEVVLLVDRSGSMEGDSIAEVRNALELCLRSLRAGCLFNIVGFGNTYRPLFPESRPYDEANLVEATAYVNAMDADMGGTEILGALRFVLEAPLRGLPRQVLLLTDGEVSNTDAVIDLVRRHAGHARVFTFGVGAGASQHLVKGVARAGEGEAELIAPGERIESKVLRQLQRALSPAVTDVEVDWGGKRAEQAPHEVSPVFAEGRVLVYARLDDAAPAAITLRAKGPEGALSFALPLDAAAAREGSLVATLWARQMIRDLEEGRSALHPRRGSLQARGRGVDDRAKDEIVRLATAHGLVSRHTSYVAVEEREERVEGETVLRKVPVALTRGWHGIERTRAAGHMDIAFAPAPAASHMDRYVEPYGITMDEEAYALDFSAPARCMPRSSPAAGSERPLDRLVRLQAANGSWALSDELEEFFLGALPRLVSRDVRAAAAACGLPDLDMSSDSARALATALALLWLEAECADTHDEWRLLAEKAHAWLDTRPGGRETWLDLAARVLAHLQSEEP
jgi:Ca-activated chloride channel family protein